MKRFLQFAIFSTMAFQCGCMSYREAKLRDADIAAKKAHKQTFEVAKIETDKDFKVEGKMTIVFQAPTQPFVAASIPDGQATNSEMIKDLAHTAAVAGTVAYGINKANGSTTNTTTNTSTTSGGAK